MSIATSYRVSEPFFAIALFCAALFIVWRIKGVWVTPAILAAGALVGTILPL